MTTQSAHVDTRDISSKMGVSAPFAIASAGNPSRSEKLFAGTYYQSTPEIVDVNMYAMPIHVPNYYVMKCCPFQLRP